MPGAFKSLHALPTAELPPASPITGMGQPRASFFQHLKKKKVVGHYLNHF